MSDPANAPSARQPALDIPLSQRQQAVLTFIHTFSQQHGYPPSIREIGQATGISSTSVVNYHLRRLIGWGLLSRGLERSRSWVLRPAGYAHLGQAVPDHCHQMLAAVQAENDRLEALCARLTGERDQLAQQLVQLEARWESQPAGPTWGAARR